ncbi:MAG TPA: DMT family transporter [bacterium]|nr:DMT family transporter [bacterium]
MLVLLAVIWGGSVPLTKLGLRDFPPLTLTALRYAVAAPCFVLLLRGRPLPPPRALAGAAGLGVLGIVGGQVLQTLGIQGTSASVATVISALIPVLVVVLAAARLRQPVRFRQALGLALAFGGVALVATGDPRRLAAVAGTGSARGDGLMVASAIAIALYYVLSVPLVRAYSVLTVAALTSLAGACGLVPISAWELRHAPAHPTAQGIAVVFYLAVLVTVFGLWVWFGALHRLPARVAAALQYLQPLVGVAASAALFGDRLSGWFWTGTALVLVGIAGSTVGAMTDPVTTGAAPPRAAQR